MAVTDHKWVFIVMLVLVAMVLSPRCEAYGTARAFNMRNFDKRKNTYGRIAEPLHRM